jgi:DNA-binding HxlR family transcriptional regulator
VSCTLDVLGDRWSLLVVRDLVRGKHRYAEFLESKEGIPTNILAERLKRLVAKGIVKAQRYSDHPPRMEYVLTPKGEDLRPIVRAMVEWGVQYAGGRTPPGYVATPYEATTVAKESRRKTTSTSKPARRSSSLSSSSPK